MNQIQPYINVPYPPGNKPIFEEWFAENYKGCNTDRELLPFFPTSFWVNNNYAQDKVAHSTVNWVLGQLDKTKKYFVICQYDDGCLVNFKELGLDVLEFNMSKRNGIMLPLLCQPHPFKFIGSKKWLANFVGSRTHPIRDEIEYLKEKSGYFISYEYTNIEAYCRAMHESIFTLCPRGYGANSFRIIEAIQYGSIPVYISDEFIIPFGIDFEEFGVIIPKDDILIIDEILSEIEPEEIIRKQNNLQRYYKEYYTFEGCIKQIIKYLEKESASTD